MNRIICLAFLLLSAFLATLAFTSCNNTEQEVSRKVAGYEVVEIDSCEYIKSRTAYSFFVITHKGNCKFCRERNQNSTTIVINGDSLDSKDNLFIGTDYK